MSEIWDFFKKWKDLVQNPLHALYARDDDRGEEGEGIDPNLQVPQIERYENGMWCDIPLLHLMPGQYFRLRQTDGQLVMGPDGHPQVFKATSFPMIEVEHPVDAGQTLTVKFAFDEFEEVPKTPTEPTDSTPTTTSPSAEAT